MKLNSIGYLIKSGFKGIFSHGLMSFATVAIITACLIIMGAFSLLVVNINDMIAGLEEESNVVVAFIDENLSREEIAIMKMVGASNGFIRCPFIVEGLVLGLLGGALAFLAEWGLYGLVSSSLLGGLTGTFFSVVPFSAVMWPLLAAFLGVGVLVGVFGGSSAIRNYLKV